MRRLAAAIIVCTWLGVALAGCGWMGRTAAKTEKVIHTGTKKVTSGIEKMDQDFKEAYREEKARQ